MIYANPVPIAACCQFGKDVVEDTLNMIWRAIADLIKDGHNLCLAFGFANVNFVNRGQKVLFAEYLTHEVKDKEFETTMRRSNSPVAQTWRSNTMNDFHKSALGTMIRKPNHEVTTTLAHKTMALNMMSKDMSSAVRKS